MNTHEVYPNAPLVLVALEVRHPATENISQVHLKELKRLLSDQFPVMRRTQQATIQFDSAGSQPENRIEEFPKFFNRENTISISMRNSSIVIEATDYPGWVTFSGIAFEALKARMTVTPLDGVERIGLRYIDEVRVPAGTPWEDWLVESVLGPRPADIQMPLSVWQGVAVYGNPLDHAVVLRYGPFEGMAVDSSELRRLHPIGNPSYFLLDIDSYWTPSHGTPEFQLEEVMSKTDILHSPVRVLFESLIKDRYRSEILRTDVLTEGKQ